MSSSERSRVGGPKRQRVGISWPVRGHWLKGLRFDTSPDYNQGCEMQVLTLVIWCWMFLFLSETALAQLRGVNVKRQDRSVVAGLETEFRGLLSSQLDPAWVGYAVPSISRRHSICCFENDASCCGHCKLEARQQGTGQNLDRSSAVQLEPPAEIIILYRLAQRQVEQIRVFSSGCELDFGGLTLFWLTGVKPSESLGWLSSLANSADSEGRWRGHKRDSTVMAVAHHAGPEADRFLEELAAPARPFELRKQAAFWLGNARGRKGYEILSRLLREDSNDKFREHVTFALTQSEEPEALTRLIETAGSDASSRVRGQALFWLAQKAGRKAASAIAAAIDQDPETSVKKKAVFALSQLPKDEGVPMLIQVARNNKNPQVRKEAMFWLGQSNDPRALAFFEEVLTK
jgi:hypothetical protein